MCSGRNSDQTCEAWGWLDNIYTRWSNSNTARCWCSPRRHGHAPLIKGCSFFLQSFIKVLPTSSADLRWMRESRLSQEKTCRQQVALCGSLLIITYTCSGRGHNHTHDFWPWFYNVWPSNAHFLFCWWNNKVWAATSTPPDKKLKSFAI